MSEFLGQIHFWLYKKIQLLADRENLILEKARGAVGDLADELHEISVDTYGAPIDPKVPLEEVIDEGNIHGWLQNQIMVSSVREASFIQDLLDATQGEEALPTVTAILDAFATHGKACGAVAKEQMAEDNAEMIYNLLQNFYVNGMPCDGGDQLVEATQDCYQWVGDHQHQMPYWQKAGINPKFMALAYQTWFQYFVEGASDNYQFIVEGQDSSQPIYAIKAK